MEMIGHLGFFTLYKRYSTSDIRVEKGKSPDFLMVSTGNGGLIPNNSTWKQQNYQKM